MTKQTPYATNLNEEHKGITLTKMDVIYKTIDKHPPRSPRVVVVTHYNHLSTIHQG